MVIIKISPYSSLVFELSGAGCKLLESQEWQWIDLGLPFPFHRVWLLLLLKEENKMHTSLGWVLCLLVLFILRVWLKYAYHSLKDSVWN